MNGTRLVPLNAIISTILWAVVVGAIVVSWILVATGHPSAAVAMGFTACIPASVAIVVTIRSYVLRLCDVIRSLHGIEPLATPAESAPDLGKVHRL